MYVCYGKYFIHGADIGFHHMEEDASYVEATYREHPNFEGWRSVWMVPGTVDPMD